MNKSDMVKPVCSLHRALFSMAKAAFPKGVMLSYSELASLLTKVHL